MKGSVASIETLGLVDGPGIRCVIFLNGCKLRCKYCHNPEMWTMKEENMTSDEVVDKVFRSKPYFKNNGGVTFSGGDPLLHTDFLIDVCKKLKEHDIHIALDTAGVGPSKYKELLPYIDLILFDVKHVDKDKYKDLVNYDINNSLEFLEECKKQNKKLWIRQVIVPGIHDNEEYIDNLYSFVSAIPNVEKVEFLPYRKFGTEKYESLGIENLYKDLHAMDQKRCDELYKMFIKKGE